MILDITGSLHLTIYYRTGTRVSNTTEKDIVQNLSKGLLFIDLVNKTIVGEDYDILYTFEFNVMESTEYNFTL